MDNLIQTFFAQLSKHIILYALISEYSVSGLLQYMDTQNLDFECLDFEFASISVVRISGYIVFEHFS